MVPAALAHVLGAAYLSNAATATLVDERLRSSAGSNAAPSGVGRGTAGGGRRRAGRHDPTNVSVAALLLAQRHVVEELTPAMFGANVAAVPPPTTLRV